MRALVLALLVAGGGLAGCVAPTTVDPGSLPDAAELLARPWIGNWAVLEQEYAIDYDPEARHVAVEGALRIQNQLGEERPYVLLLLEPYAIDAVTDEDGTPLDYTIEDVGDLVPLLPEPAREPIFHFMTVNVTLPGDVGHGAVRTLHVAYSGWSVFDAAPFGPGVDAPADLPNDVTQNLHFALLPILSRLPTTETRFTLTAPSDWVVLPAAMPYAAEENGGTTTTSYAIRASSVAFASAKGLEWLEEDLGGVEVKTFFYPDMRQQGRVAHEVTKRVLREMPKYTGPYPYEHLWTVPAPVVVNAFSVPGMSFLGLNFYRGALADVPVQFGRTLVPFVGGQDGFENVIVHEHVHNWWGWNVYGNVSTQEVRTGWVTEGITTYLSELVWLTTQYGAEDGGASGRDKALALFVTERGVVEGHDGSARPGGSQYVGTAVGLRALEAYAIATDRPNATFVALETVQARYGLAAGGASWVTEEQVFGVFEEVFGEDLDGLWDAYISDGNLPQLRVGAVTASAGNVTVEVEGAALAGAEVRAVTASGRELWGWAVVRDGAGAVDLAVPPGAGMDPVVRVEVDPHHWVYEANEFDNVWVGRA